MFQLMGIVNVTPDSFSDGGRHADEEAAVAHGGRLIGDGAALLDVGGESTRPGAEPVAADEELRRVVPVIARLATHPAVASGAVTLSVDTSKLVVARAAVEAGAGLVNDVTAFRADPELAGFVAQRGLRCCLMHMLGEPRTMMDDPRYDDVVDDVKAFLDERLRFAVDAGVAESRILLDPGIGFGKTAEHNLELLRRLDEIVALGPPLLIGTSRKAFLGHLTGRSVTDRAVATAASCVLAYLKGATIFRVHDVAQVADALRVAAATVPDAWPGTTMTSPTT